MIRPAVVRAVLALAVAVAASTGPTALAAVPPIRTAFVLPADSAGSGYALQASRMRAAGATAARLPLDWAAVASGERAALNDPTDPDDPGYNWTDIDRRVAIAVAAGLEPILDLEGAPAWAQGTLGGGDSSGSGTVKPNAAAYGAFALAAARRYSGSHKGLPRVRYWQVWNEPNTSTNLVPQLVNGRPYSPKLYRHLVNALAASVKSVHGNNLVIAGGTAPFRDSTDSVVAQIADWGPLTFMRKLLCLSPSLKPTCSEKLHFDIWSTHPYTSGGPEHHAALPDDVSLGDLPKMRAVLDAAVKAHHVAGGVRPGFWVTEFSWDSKPPDPRGVPQSLLRRWVPQALYTMWASGVSLVTWLSTRDEPLTTSFNQGGLWTRGARTAGDRRKSFFEGFRFPVVAESRRGGIYVWGRTPAGVPGTVDVELRSGGAWRRLGVLRARQGGVFHHTFANGATKGSVRAVLSATGERSLPYSLTPVPDRFYNPFGLTSLLELKGTRR